MAGSNHRPTVSSPTRKRFWSRVFGLFRRKDRISFLDQKIKILKEDLEGSEEEIELDKRALAELQRRMEERIEKLLLSLDNQKAINKKLEITLDATNEELKIMQEVTIPGLLAANQAITSQWETQAHIERIKQGAQAIEREVIE